MSMPNDLTWQVRLVIMIDVSCAREQNNTIKVIGRRAPYGTQIASREVQGV